MHHFELGQTDGLTYGGYSNTDLLTARPKKKEEKLNQTKPDCGTVRKSLNLVGLQHFCASTHQLTAPDGSATTYIARTDSRKVALITAVECLPSKLPRCAAADVSATARTLTHAQMQTARTHSTLTPPARNLLAARSLSVGCRGRGP
jgi:hypothetical protein